MKRQIMWAPWIGWGLEHLLLTQSATSIVANGSILVIEDQEPLRVQYEITCDPQWRARTLKMSVTGQLSQRLELSTDGQGLWHREDGSALPELQGCLDLDISATPFTNTLPIRRLDLQPGQAATLKMLYIQIPQLGLSATEQRYTCLERTQTSASYRFESLEHGTSVFTATLPVDRDGLVGDYPDLFKLVQSW